MNSALETIIGYKRDEVAALKRAHSTAKLLQMAQAQPAPRPFMQALRQVMQDGENGLICELKRKSPSAGAILPGADPVSIAQAYAAGGAACLSVLTDGPSFGGSAEDFRAIRAGMHLPMLRKDFMIDPLQVVEARAMGADAILVILACTDNALAKDLVQTAEDLGMASLIETHDADEVTRALALPSPLIGINNRDLNIMRTDLNTTERLASRVPDECLLISESGIAEPEDISRLRRAGAQCFLIGESLMKRDDRAAHVQRLRQAQ